MFYTQLSDTPDHQWPSGKAYETAEAAEHAARLVHAMRKSSVDIVQIVQAGRARAHRPTKVYIAKVLSDALGRTWTQVSVSGGLFL